MIDSRIINIFKGITIHFGASILFLMSFWFVDFTIQNIMLSFLTFGMIFTCFILIFEYNHPIVEHHKTSWYSYDYNDCYNFVKDTFFSGIIIGDLCVMFTNMFTNMFIDISHYHLISKYNTIIKMTIVFLLVDATYFLIHRNLMHNLKGNKYNFIYILHKIHHSIKNIDYIRGTHASVIENGIIGFQLWVGIYGGLAGLDVCESLVIIHVILLLQLSHHANHDFDIGFIKYIFMDNHSHKIHHCNGGQNHNLGGILSIWDVFNKSLIIDRKT